MFSHFTSIGLLQDKAVGGSFKGICSHFISIGLLQASCPFILAKKCHSKNLMFQTVALYLFIGPGTCFVHP